MTARDTLIEVMKARGFDADFDDATFILSALTAAGHRIAGPADMEAVEAGAAAVDPEIWAMDAPIPTRADTEAFHARRQKSVEIAKAVLTAASPHMPVPAGWVLVPEEPNVEMISAWYRYKNGHRFAGEPPARDTSDYGAYRAMLASRPEGRRVR